MPNLSVPAAAEPNAQPPSLSAAISLYRYHWNAFLADPQSEDLGVGVSHPVRSSRIIIETWNRAAETRSEAADALRLALEDYEAGDTPRIPAMITAALGFLEGRSVEDEMQVDLWNPAEHHARGLAKAMATWPPELRFQITIVPHDAAQPLFWLSKPNATAEVGQLTECINAYKAAVKAFAAVCKADDAESAEASEREDRALADLLAFVCRTAQAKALKTEYIISLLRQPSHPKLDSDQLERLLDSLIQ